MVHPSLSTDLVVVSSVQAPRGSSGVTVSSPGCSGTVAASVETQLRAGLEPKNVLISPVLPGMLVGFFFWYLLVPGFCKEVKSASPFLDQESVRASAEPAESTNTRTMFQSTHYLAVAALGLSASALTVPVRRGKTNLKTKQVVRTIAD